MASSDVSSTNTISTTTTDTSSNISSSKNPNDNIIIIKPSSATTTTTAINKHSISHHRYVHSSLNYNHYLNYLKRSNAEAKAFLSRAGKVIIRMRGLPFDSVAKDVVEFFRNGENSCEILDEESGVLFVHYPDGRATGDAFVMTKSEEEAARALLKHKETMGTRYIELFRSTSAEVQQVFKRSQDPKFYQNSLLLKSDMSLSSSSMASMASATSQNTAAAAAVAALAASAALNSTNPAAVVAHTASLPLPLLPPEMLSGGGGTKRDCIRLRNLPLECGVEQILEFLGVHSQHILPHGVHMILNAQAQPSGESFIQFDSEQSVYNVCVHKNGKCMYFGGKKHFVEVIQCSGEEMNLVLMGLLPSNLLTSPSVAAATTAPSNFSSPPPLMPSSPQSSTSSHNTTAPYNNYKSTKFGTSTKPSLMRTISGNSSMGGNSHHSATSPYLMFGGPTQSQPLINPTFQMPAVPNTAQLNGASAAAAVGIGTLTSGSLIYPSLNHHSTALINAQVPPPPSHLRTTLNSNAAAASPTSLMTSQFTTTPQPYGPIIWYYPTPPVSPTTSAALFYHHSQQSPIIAYHSTNGSPTTSASAAAPPLPVTPLHSHHHHPHPHSHHLLQQHHHPHHNSHLVTGVPQPQPQQQQQPMNNTPCILVLKNAPYNVTVSDVLNFFTGYEILPDSIQIQSSTNPTTTTTSESYPTSNANQTTTGSNNSSTTTTSDVFITLYNRNEAQRALVEKNHQKIAANPIELFLSVC